MTIPFSGVLQMKLSRKQKMISFLLGALLVAGLALAILYSSEVHLLNAESPKQDKGPTIPMPLATSGVDDGGAEEFVCRAERKQLPVGRGYSVFIQAMNGDIPMASTRLQYMLSIRTPKVESKVLTWEIRSRRDPTAILSLCTEGARDRGFV
jgi:hypothetical protein